MEPMIVLGTDMALVPSDLAVFRVLRGTAVSVRSGPARSLAAIFPIEAVVRDVVVSVVYLERNVSSENDILQRN